ncbi:kinase-like domain-containing protein, partial [Pilobolus umbonatus]
MMSNDLLLRLFQSDYFNTWIALCYLFKYPENERINSYLCTQLSACPVEEIEYYLPQHILMSRPTMSLERVMITLCEQSTHFTVMCLWYLQCYLPSLLISDPAFLTCQRMITLCQSILLGHPHIACQMEFMVTMVDISSRLMIVPKETRTSALHAELSVLNQQLPAEICIPLWCPGKKSCHHRMVRFSESVVLNSAERTPYLVMMEVLDETEESVQCSPVSPLDSSSFDFEVTQDPYAERMKTAAILLTQLEITMPANKEMIRTKIIAEMMGLEEERLEKMKIGLKEPKVRMVMNKEDPSVIVFSEDWEAKKERIRLNSPYGHLPHWKLISFIVKSGTDLRQEQFAVQMIREMQKIWHQEKVDVWVQCNRILVTSDESGLIETIKNAISIHSIKKKALSGTDGYYSLFQYYIKKWGAPESSSFKKAQDRFMRSLAGYSIASYLMQIKDRHNGNLLIDDAGHIIHIDFGFILSNSPGSVGFEMAPFKLCQEYIDILGGLQSAVFKEYKALVHRGFMALRKHSDTLLLFAEIMAYRSKLPCFQYENTLSLFKERFQLQLTEVQMKQYLDKLIMSSSGNLFTKLYDRYQYYSQVRKTKKKQASQGLFYSLYQNKGIL